MQLDNAVKNLIRLTGGQSFNRTCDDGLPITWGAGAMYVRSCLTLLIAAATLAPAGAAQPLVSHAAKPRSMSPEADTYLAAAIKLFREQHINASKVDWQALSAKAYAAADGAKTTADTYSAIWLIIRALGEKHTFFIGPDQAKAQATGKQTGHAEPPPLLLPEGIRLANGIGVIRLYAFSGSAEQGVRYAQTAQAKIHEMKRNGVCRFVLDLRENTGGNMYPMLTGVRDLLEPGFLGSFETPQGRYAPWAIANGAATTLPLRDELPRSESLRSASPVAVLIGPQTISSGEFTAMSFEGRANTRFFGAPSGGYVTANSPVPLSDGAVILMTNSWGHDRTGKKYVDKIEPDENTGAGGQSFDAALTWLSRQPCGRTRNLKAARRPD